MNQVLGFYNQNKEVINFLLAFIVYVVFHRTAAIAFVKNKSSKAMLGVEKSAEQLVLKTGEDKMNTVVDSIYKILPGWVRVVVSPDKFKGIAQTLFDEAKTFTEQNIKPQNETKADVTK